MAKAEQITIRMCRAQLDPSNETCSGWTIRHFQDRMEVNFSALPRQEIPVCILSCHTSRHNLQASWAWLIISTLSQLATALTSTGSNS